MNIKILRQTEKQEIIKQLEKQFGVNEMPNNLNLVKIGGDRLIAFSGNLTEEQIRKLQKIVFVERIGVYFGRQDENTKEIRLSIEGSQMLGRQTTTNIFELNEEQLLEWMKGNELNISTGKRGFLIIKYKNDFLGTGKASENKISNFVPKERRIKINKFSFQHQ